MRQAEIYRKDVLAGILTEDGGDIHDSNRLFTHCLRRNEKQRPTNARKSL